jgi:hypothetical protein
MGPIETRSASASREEQSPLWVRIGFWACTAIAVAVVIRRIFALAFPPRSAPPQLAVLDSFFASHAALTLAHIIPALAFVLIAPFVVFRAHAQTAWQGKFLGGWIERSAVLFFNSLFLLSLLRAHLYRRANDLAGERRWLLRAIVILLGIATTRPVMGVFFATSPLTHLTPSQFFGIAFWIGFSINTCVIELWLRMQARKDTHRSPVLTSRGKPSGPAPGN